MWLTNAMHLTESMRFVAGEIHIDDGGVIDAIEAPGTVSATDDEVIDCSECLVIPGLVNAQFQSQSTLLRGLDRGNPLGAEHDLQAELWARAVEFLDRQASEEEFKTVCVKEYAELIHQGVTFCADSGIGERSPAVFADAMDQIGLRGIIDAYNQFESVAPRSRYDRIEFAAHLPEEEDITQESLAAAQAIKTRYDPIFLAESDETAYVATEWGKSSLELFADMRLLSEKVVLFHPVDPPETDIQIIRKHRASVVHCPVTELPDIAPVEEFLATGINVGIGTGWGRTDIWEAMRLAHGLFREHERNRRLSAEAIFGLATINGANAFLQNNKIGRIALGFDADLTWLDKDAIGLLPVIDHDGYSTTCHNLLIAGHAALVRHVMVAGNWIMRDQRILSINEAHVHARYREIVARIFSDSA